jgi:peptide/nickel transport system permease protein
VTGPTLDAATVAIVEAAIDPFDRPEGRRWLNGPLVAGVAIVGILLIASFAVPAVSSYDPYAAYPDQALLAPSGAHPFGTDESGHDIFVRVFYAARIDLPIAALGVALGFVLGTALGVITGAARGWLGEAALRMTDLVQAFPLFILAIALVALSGNSRSNIVLALGFLNAPIFLRLVRSRTVTLREHRYIEAAVALGNPPSRVLRKHLLPNAIGPAIVQCGIAMGYAIITIAGLAFLSVGVQVPTPEWGSMILVGSNAITTGQWWTYMFPGLVLAIAVIGFNLLSEGVEIAREVER